MDTDSLPSGLVFAASLLLYFYLSLVHRPDVSVGAQFSDTKSRRWVAAGVPWLKSACVIAGALSGLALVHSTGTVRWWPASFLALGLLIFLAALHRVAGLTLASRLFLPGVLQRAMGQRISGQAAASGQARAGDTELSPDGAEGNQSEDSFPDRVQPEITSAELVSLDQRDLEMLRSILRLDLTTAREIMTPRLDMIAVENDATLSQVCELMVQGGHSRLPVYEETIDRILGVVHARDVMDAMVNENSEKSLHPLIRQAFIIPETKRLDDLLEELQDKGVQMAIVVDEYGGTEGLVTLEDVLEEIVGEIEDEFSRTREASVVRLPDGSALVDAGINRENVEEIFGTGIESADVDTVGGFVYHSLGKIPQVGDVVVTDHLRIEVVSILGRRLRKLRINRIDANGAENEN